MEENVNLLTAFKVVIGILKKERKKNFVQKLKCGVLQQPKRWLQMGL